MTIYQACSKIFPAKRNEGYCEICKGGIHIGDKVCYIGYRKLIHADHHHIAKGVKVKKVAPKPQKVAPQLIKHGDMIQVFEKQVIRLEEEKKEISSRLEKVTGKLEKSYEDYEDLENSHVGLADICENQQKTISSYKFSFMVVSIFNLFTIVSGVALKVLGAL